MIDFKEVALDDRVWAEPILFRYGLRGCDNTFTAMYTWQQAYGIRIARWNRFVLGMMSSVYGTVYYYPIGTGDIQSAIEAIRQDAEERGVEFQMVCVTREMIESLEHFYPGRFRYEAYRDAYDYIYEIDRLADLPGKKLHAKRNHIHRFEAEHPLWSACPVTGELIPLCREIEARWQKEAAGNLEPGSHEDTDQRYEYVSLQTALDDFCGLGLEGILILTEEGPAAFALGKQVSKNSYNIHFEKAISTIQGSYAVVNREYARWIRDKHPTVRYINREDDMGVPGLRRAKASYYPDRMLEKYSAIWIG